MILAAPSRLGGSNHQEKQANPIAKYNHQVHLDAITQAMHLDALNSHQMMNQSSRMSEREMSMLTIEMAKRVSKSRPTRLYRAPTDHIVIGLKTQLLWADRTHGP
jgi:hypothetical protein